MVLEPARVLVGERQHPHAVAPSVQRRDEVPPHEAVAAGDEDPHRAAPAGAAIRSPAPRYHATLRLTPSARSTSGKKPSSRLARSMTKRFSPPKSCRPYRMTGGGSLLRESRARASETAPSLRASG